MTARGHMMPPLLHVCNGLARPADELLARHIGTTGHSENIIASAAHSLSRHKNHKRKIQKNVRRAKYVATTISC